MTGLFHTLNIGAESLYATRQGVDTAGHNIANAQVEGYSRQRVNIRQRDPLATHGILIGNGAYVGSISREHDKFIENQLNRANQDAGRAKARADGMRNVEQIFSPELNASVSDEMTKFFNSMETLANFPADFTVRTSVVESGKDVASALRRVDADLKENRFALNERIGQTCSEVSDQLQEIATLNVKIQTSEAGEGQQANDLRDQRDKLVRSISEKIEVKYYDDKNGMVCIRGPDQVNLVDGGHAAKIDVQRDNAQGGMYNVAITDWEGRTTRDVTRKMDGGALDALVEMRDVDLTHLIDKNNEMAYTFANAVNEVHQAGYGLNDFSERAGRNFFTTPSSLAHAAEEIDVDDIIKNSNDAIAAASSPLAPGDNVNLNQLLKLKDAKIFTDSGVNLNEFYANYTGDLGLDVVRAEHINEAHNAVVQDLNQRREAVAGVSLDEEATNMMKWQANFTASSKVITTVDEMIDTVLQMKR